MSTERLCVTCKSFYLEGEEADHSEYTPGADASVGCYRMVWGDSLNSMSMRDFREYIRIARTCDHYEEASE